MDDLARHTWTQKYMREIWGPFGGGYYKSGKYFPGGGGRATHYCMAAPPKTGQCREGGVSSLPNSFTTIHRLASKGNSRYCKLLLLMSASQFIFYFFFRFLAVSARSDRRLPADHVQSHTIHLNIATTAGSCASPSSSSSSYMRSLAYQQTR